MNIYIDNISDLTESNFFAIFKKNLQDRVYKIGRLKNCYQQISKKTFTLINSSEYIIFKINWNIENLFSNKTYITTSFTNEDLFLSNNKEIYELLLISVSNDINRLIFYEYNSN